jgi:glycosyltransferase involved in cell wall biosynthesis
MKVLMISKALIVGAYHGKLREMAKLGVDLTLILPHRWANQKLEIRDATEYKIRVLPCVLSGQNHFHFYRSKIGPIDADLVHIDEDPWSLVTYQFMKACVKQRKPTVFFTWQNIYKHYPPPFRHFESYSYQNATAAIAGNEEAREILLARKFGKSIRVIPQFGVDPELYRKRDAREARKRFGLENKFIIGFAGRIKKEKGISDLISALALLPERYVLVLVGNGEFRSMAENLAQKLGVTSRIRWISSVSSFQIPEFMNLFDVLVLPSRTTPRWKEQFGRVLIEAMACETVVVGSDSGQIPTVIGNAGLVFPEGNVDALVVHLERLEADHQLASELGAAGRRRVLQNFTHERIAAQTLEFYEHTMARFYAGEARDIDSPSETIQLGMPSS